MRKNDSYDPNPIMRWFESAHLADEDIRAISVKVAALATALDFCIEHNSPEKSAGLRKLLEAKDCFVRAMIINKEEGGLESDEQEEEDTEVDRETIG